MAAAQIRPGYLSPDMMIESYNQDTGEVRQSDYLGVVLVELTRKNHQQLWFINLKMYPRIYNQLKTQGFNLEGAKDDDARWSEYTLQVDEGMPRRQFYVFLWWASGKLRLILLTL